ncbi:hypothetical protein A3G55_00125 [Candidatus Giovannonibacteria bacterium RIFCSPLOWO2_12_FULL_44_25]|uniref:Uncharacterized protein n=4 Tax=Parcubacteria group TaxID=1794811 RepID=A0A837IHB2_9BACT|nr:MAG: hypothetical protein UW49_C0005G0023 [Candidatus Giovannonibacteria bacterium GW2011_GWB1_44_23]KKT59683.1 MAG: hypothetical protein UW53_C0009G0023 [Candidatus Giovannonibacteria bacterium GW2011_GWA1_44_25]KKU12995.1 MAG: hypothetical protein UX18_C0004G0011 [Candidatus Azambacteria bacterium GW2011_GWC2_45_7b]OGF50060.1 MAG: hypothetical protein A2120_02935 [Candidatus Giovannonibacteria bacterium GWA2_45_15]OGF59105.1 MAG: hypothetical protein A2W40_01090 [Candidatus Giovannonibacte
MGDLESEALSNRYVPSVERAFAAFHDIEGEKGQVIKALLVSVAKELFEDNFPKMTFSVQHGSVFHEVLLTGILVHAPREGDKDLIYVLMLPDGLYETGGDCMIDVSFRADLLRPMTLWQYANWARHALHAMNDKKSVSI